MNGREKSMAEKRAELVRCRARMAEVYPQALDPRSKFSGPSVDVFLEDWAKVGFHAPMGHYWRRRPEDRVLSTCGISKALQYAIRGQVMIFEVGSFPKCAKCVRMRQGLKP